MADSAEHRALKRELGVWSASALGLGSIIGTGVFVSLGVAAGIVGPAVILALVIGAIVALFNGLSSAQLAASHPVSGGTYEYGYTYLGPLPGFTAGWLFLLAKSASAATAALGFSGYVLNAFGLYDHPLFVPLALAIVLTVVLLVLSGIRRSSHANVLIVSLTIAALLAFVAVGAGSSAPTATENLSPFFQPEEGASVLSALMRASALLFVAYTGYGRLATLGEEVRDPVHTIPRAVILTLVVTLILYVAVATVGVAAVGSGGMAAATGQEAAPLEVAARSFSPLVARVVSLGAVTAMVGVLLNLVLGLSRVLLAMGRRGDMPVGVARIDRSGTTPHVAVIVMGIVIGLLVLIGDVRTTWSFSAFTVLIYYAITNAAALRLPAAKQRYPRWIPIAGLISCLSLAFWVDGDVLLFGLGLIGIGLIWHLVRKRWRRRSDE